MGGLSSVSDPGPLRDRRLLSVDGIYESLRRYGAKEGILCAWCITSDGRKLLLHLAVGNQKSEDCWTEFLRDMVGRGLKVPTSVTCDGAPGLLNAVAKVFAKSLRIRCWYHELGNIRSKLPAEGVDEVLAHVRCGGRCADSGDRRADCSRRLGALQRSLSRRHGLSHRRPRGVARPPAAAGAPPHQRADDNLLERTFEEDASARR